VRSSASSTTSPSSRTSSLQRRVWGFGDLDVVPVHLLLTAAHNGGLVLAAYLDDGRRRHALRLRRADRTTADRSTART
jgi:hypothetical protein